MSKIVQILRHGVHHETPKQTYLRLRRTSGALELSYLGTTLIEKFTEWGMIANLMVVFALLIVSGYLFTDERERKEEEEGV